MPQKTAYHVRKALACFQCLLCHELAVRLWAGPSLWLTVTYLKVRVCTEWKAPFSIKEESIFYFTLALLTCPSLPCKMYRLFLAKNFTDE